MEPAEADLGIASTIHTVDRQQAIKRSLTVTKDILDLVSRSFNDMVS